MEMVGRFTTEATIQIKHFRKGGSFKWKHMFWATITDGKPAASDKATLGEKGRETAKTQPEPAIGWVLFGWVPGRSLSNNNHNNKPWQQEQNKNYFSKLR